VKEVERMARGWEVWRGRGWEVWRARECEEEVRFIAL
jgi:hypothetical protein